MVEKRLWIKSQMPDFGIAEFDQLAFTALNEAKVVDWYSQLIDLKRPDKYGNTKLPAWWLANLCSEKAAASVKVHGLEKICALAAWFSQLGWFAAIKEKQQALSEAKTDTTWMGVAAHVRRSAMECALMESGLVRARPVDSLALCRMWGLNENRLLDVNQMGEHQAFKQSLEMALKKSQHEIMLIMFAVSTAQAQILSLWWEQK